MESKEQAQMVKGKRTKRQRPLSPVPFSIPENSCKEGKFDSVNHTNMKFLPGSSNEYLNSCTEEEEEMANCLILLAQGQHIRRDQSPKESDDSKNVETCKFNSRRFLETASNGDGKAGYYVYECKTCNRVFPSFQALGGHRASHKKPRHTNAEEIRKSNKKLVIPDEDQDGRYRNINSPFSLQLSYNHRGTYSNIYMNNHNNNGNKVHECGFCGAEFNSGQALGGHMRRHRGPVGANTALSLTTMATESDHQDRHKKSRNVLSLDLDLNLPAPEGDNAELGSHFASKQEQKQEQDETKQQQHEHQQQPSLVLSAPTLIDCHY